MKLIRGKYSNFNANLSVVNHKFCTFDEVLQLMLFTTYSKALADPGGEVCPLINVLSFCMQFMYTYDSYETLFAYNVVLI